MNTTDRWHRFRAAVLDAMTTHHTRSGAWRAWAWVALVLAVASALYPSDHARDYRQSKGGRDRLAVTVVEDGLRHLNTVVAVALPVLHRDLAGMTQLAVVTVVGTAATHIPKQVINDWEIAGTRLGQRPLNPQSQHNMPSGHSSLASAAAWFVCRRYGWRWAWLLLPITAATMWARVMLDAHTVSAVFAGMFVGMAVALWVVSPRARKVTPTQSSPGVCWRRRRSRG